MQSCTTQSLRQTQITKAKVLCHIYDNFLLALLNSMRDIFKFDDDLCVLFTFKNKVQTELIIESCDFENIPENHALYVSTIYLHTYAAPPSTSDSSD